MSQNNTLTNANYRDVKLHEATCRYSDINSGNHVDPDDDRIVSHDAIFYVHDATSKLSVISS